MYAFGGWRRQFCVYVCVLRGGQDGGWEMKGSAKVSFSGTVINKGRVLLWPIFVHTTDLDKVYNKMA